MKDYLKFFLIIFFFGVILRFYNFSERIIYGPEQARSLLTATRNLTQGFSLLGQEYFRYTSSGHQLFYSPLFPYSLIPLVLLAKYSPLYITIYFALLNIFTGLFLFYVAKKIFNKTVAVFTFFLFFLNSYMIYHSLFIWPYNYLPLIGVTVLYLVYLFQKNQKPSYILLLGTLSGAGFGIQYLFAPLSLGLLLFLIWKGKRRVLIFLIFLFGNIIGNLPMVVFDLRNQFYNSKSLWQFFIDTIQGNSDAAFNYYYLLPLWPIFILLGALFLYFLTKKSWFVVLIVMFLYVFINLKSSQ